MDSWRRRRHLFSILFLSYCFYDDIQVFGRLNNCMNGNEMRIICILKELPSGDCEFSKNNFFVVSCRKRKKKWNQQNNKILSLSRLFVSFWLSGTGWKEAECCVVWFHALESLCEEKIETENEVHSSCGRIDYCVARILSQHTLKFQSRIRLRELVHGIWFRHLSLVWLLE